MAVLRCQATQIWTIILEPLHMIQNMVLGASVNMQEWFGGKYNIAADFNPLWSCLAPSCAVVLHTLPSSDRGIQQLTSLHLCSLLCRS